MPAHVERTARKNVGAYRRRGGRRAGAAGPGVQRVAARDVPDGGGDRGELWPAWLRLGWLWEVHPAEN